MTMQAKYWKLIKITEDADFPFSLPEFKNDLLKNQWLSSRFSLWELCQNHIPHFDFQSSEALKISNFHSLSHYPSFKVSLAHTKEIGVAALSHDESILGLGVDIEIKGRVIKDGSQKFFVHQKDFDLNHLKLWAGKEAAFKATSYYWPFDKNQVLTDLWIQDSFFGYEETTLGEIEWFEEQYQGHDLVGAVALMTHQFKEV